MKRKQNRKPLTKEQNDHYTNAAKALIAIMPDGKDKDICQAIIKDIAEYDRLHDQIEKNLSELGIIINRQQAKQSQPNWFNKPKGDE